MRRVPARPWRPPARRYAAACLALLLALAAGCGPGLPQPVTRPARPKEVPKKPAAPPPAPQPAPQPPQPAAPPPSHPALRPEPVPDAAGPTPPILLKVGLASDLAVVTLPCCDGGLTAMVGGKLVAAVAPLRIEPAAGITRQGFYRLQVAALRDERQAQDLARRLERQSGLPGEAHFDASIDLYRVRVGRYSAREAAEGDLRRLSTLGVIGAFVVFDGGGVAEPALRVVQGDTSTVYPGRWLAINPTGQGGIRVQGKRYRGRILVYLNDRGTLNVVNELPAEDYLRGVVPSEMGPEQYRQLEALKAQAVAARTYTLRNLGEFAREGYDICATPRCQVYGGMDVEHPLSDRAVAETAGQVLLYHGELVDALYSSTCGGHTEDVHVMFPLKEEEPYLKGVPCIEEGFVHLPGDLPAGTAFPAGLTSHVLPEFAPGSPSQVLAARLAHLALLAGLPAPDKERLASLDRRAVQRFVASSFDLALDAKLLLAPQDVAYLLKDPPADWSEDDRRRAAWLLRSGLLAGPLDQPLRQDEIERMLLALAELLRVVRREDVSFLAAADGKLTVRSGKDDKTYNLPEHLATFRRRGPEMAASDLAVLPGDNLVLFWHDDNLLAVIQEVSLEGAAFDRSSQYSSWTRFRSDSQLASQVGTRFPGLGFRNFEILARGESGRVGKIRIEGEGGRTAEVDGLAVRWTLDIPDTLFTAKRLTPPRQEPGWLFTGRGWGHGVGLCQVGAYGMAQRGHSYREILYHYYSGVELSRVRLVDPSGGGGARQDSR
ncbi:MAG TPA: SpoIID/LytB domain-containing protein [Thermoanaerobaculia bacterium]|nr:SpoIID/LytB domain-containing protein [Thermoanaerobaculia bacterium]